MTLHLTHLVDPDDYDNLLYDLVHQVLDRTIELASQVDQTDEDGPDDSEESDILETLRSQAAFTPAEKNELSLTHVMLSMLINVCIARRAGLYPQQPHDLASPVDPSAS